MTRSNLTFLPQESVAIYGRSLTPLDYLRTENFRIREFAQPPPPRTKLRTRTKSSNIKSSYLSSHVVIMGALRGAIPSLSKSPFSI